MEDENGLLKFCVHLSRRRWRLSDAARWRMLLNRPARWLRMYLGG